MKIFRVDAFAARTGAVRCRLAEGQVVLCGKAVTVMRGEVLV